MSTFLWVALAVLYFVFIPVLGLATLRKDHYAMFWLGILFPGDDGAYGPWVAS